MDKCGKYILGICFLFLLSFFLGCGSPQKGVTVINDSHADLSFLEGHWKANKFGWEFNFNDKGEITFARLSMGRFKVVPGERNIIDMKFDKQTVIDPNEWIVAYQDQTKELMVTINISHFSAQLKDDFVEGSSRDVIVGNLVDDNTWKAEWLTFPNVVVRMEDKEVKLLDPSVDKEDVSCRGELTFRKVSD